MNSDPAIPISAEYRLMNIPIPKRIRPTKNKAMKYSLDR